MKLILFLLSFALGISASGAVLANDDPNPLIGKQLFRSYCFVCHGKDGNSRGPVAKRRNLYPADLTASKYQNKSTDELAELIGAYRTGEAAKMPNWGLVLPKSDLLDIASYIVFLNSEDIRYKGDARQGRITYKNACISCHGKFVAGDGHLAHLIHIPMKDLSKSMKVKNLSDEELIQVISRGRGEYMPPWKGTLSDSEIINVAAYIRMLTK